jgi:hypothetical protein
VTTLGISERHARASSQPHLRQLPVVKKTNSYLCSNDCDCKPGCNRKSRSEKPHPVVPFFSPFGPFGLNIYSGKKGGKRMFESKRLRSP